MIYKFNEQATQRVWISHSSVASARAEEAAPPPRNGSEGVPPTPLKVRRDTVIKFIPAAQPDKESKVGSQRPLVSNAVLWNICSRSSGS